MYATQTTVLPCQVIVSYLPRDAQCLESLYSRASRQSAHSRRRASFCCVTLTRDQEKVGRSLPPLTGVVARETAGCMISLDTAAKRAAWVNATPGRYAKGLIVGALHCHACLWSHAYWIGLATAPLGDNETPFSNLGGRESPAHGFRAVIIALGSSPSQTGALCSPLKGDGSRPQRGSLFLEKRKLVSVVFSWCLNSDRIIIRPVPGRLFFRVGIGSVRDSSQRDVNPSSRTQHCWSDVSPP